jgi:hypothetical protein
MFFVSGCASSPFAETGKVTKMRVALAAPAPADTTYRIAVGRITDVYGTGQNPGVFFNTTTVSHAPPTVTVRKGKQDADFTIQPENKLCDETLVFILREGASTNVAGVGTIAVKAPKGVECENGKKVAPPKHGVRAQGTKTPRRVGTPISVGRR